MNEHAPDETDDGLTRLQIADVPRVVAPPDVPMMGSGMDAFDPTTVQNTPIKLKSEAGGSVSSKVTLPVASASA